MPSRRSDIAFTPEEQERFLAAGWTLQVASIGPHGFPHLVAMWYVVDDGLVTFTTFRKSQKVLNLQRNPKLTVMLEAGRLYGELQGLVIEGNAEIVDDTDETMRIMGLVGAKYSGYGAGANDPAAQRRIAAKRLTIRVRPVDTYTWDHTKLGGRY